MYRAALRTSLLVSCGLAAQTQVDLRTQSKNVDFSSAIATKPAKAGTLLPSACSVGEMFFKTDAVAGQNLHLCVGLNTWNQIQGNGSQGGSGVSNASALADLQTVRLSPSTLTIGAGCGLATPCVVSWGNRSVALTTPASVSITAGTGIAFVYVSFQGVLTVGHTMTASCNGCQTQLGVTSFPADSIPVATWSSTGGTWDANGGLDMRGFLGNKPVGAGTGLISADIAGQAILSVDSSVVGVRVAAPATSSASCSTGNYAVDSQFHYVCVALNTWRRTATTTW